MNCCNDDFLMFNVFSKGITLHSYLLHDVNMHVHVAACTTVTSGLDYNKS